MTSKPLERQDRLHPEPVSGLNATKITDKEITLVWQPPIGDYDHFDVLYDRGFGRDRLTTNSTLVNSITIRRLRPFKNYTFSVFTISGKKYLIVFASNAVNLEGTLFGFLRLKIKKYKISFDFDCCQNSKREQAMLSLLVLNCDNDN